MKKETLCSTCLRTASKTDSKKMLDIINSPWLIVDKSTIASTACNNCKTQRLGLRWEVITR